MIKLNIENFGSDTKSVALEYVDAIVARYGSELAGADARVIFAKVLGMFRASEPTFEPAKVGEDKTEDQWLLVLVYGSLCRRLGIELIGK